MKCVQAILQFSSTCERSAKRHTVTPAFLVTTPALQQAGWAWGQRARRTIAERFAIVGYVVWARQRSNIDGFHSGRAGRRAAARLPPGSRQSPPWQADLRLLGTLFWALDGIPNRRHPVGMGARLSIGRPSGEQRIVRSYMDRLR